MTVFAVIGSRTGFTEEEVFNYLVERCDFDDCIVTGGALGVDKFAENFADFTGLPCIVYLPDFQKNGTPYNVQDYFKRNRAIVDKCDCLIAFWDGESRGAKYTIDYAKSEDKLHAVVSPMRVK